MTFQLMPAYKPGNLNDPFFANVHLLMQFESTVVKDSSVKNMAFTLAGTPIVDTSDKRFGLSSLRTNGANCLYTAGFYTTLTGPLTLEFFMKPAATQPTGTGGILDCRTDSGGLHPRFGYMTDGTVALSLDTNSRYTGVISKTDWTHIALTRNASNLWRLFQNGTQIGTTFSYSNPFAGKYTIGAFVTGQNTANSNKFNGWLDELRITNGVCRYDSNFEVPSTSFPTR